MRWTEPWHCAIARARIWNPPSVILRSAGLVGVASIVVFGIACLLIFRFEAGRWRWRDALALGCITGAVAAITTGIKCLPVLNSKRQKIDLRSHEFWIKGDREFTTA